MASKTPAKKLDHIALMVSDLERSTKFYQDILGLQKVADYEEWNIPALSKAHGLSDVQLKLASWLRRRTPKLRYTFSKFRIRSAQPSATPSITFPVPIYVLRSTTLKKHTR
jgi:catechol 2,3-dioxygenase-like lactoylglutathione lyase family enzyme